MLPARISPAAKAAGAASAQAAATASAVATRMRRLRRFVIRIGSSRRGYPDARAASFVVEIIFVVVFFVVIVVVVPVLVRRVADRGVALAGPWHPPARGKHGRGLPGAERIDQRIGEGHVRPRWPVCGA